MIVDGRALPYEEEEKNPESEFPPTDEELFL